MLHREKVISALESKAKEFADYDKEAVDLLEIYEKGLVTLESLSQEELLARLEEVAWPGARPTREQDQSPGIILPFGKSWQNHQDARAWAKRVLTDLPTIAVDGSQITPSKNFSIPVGAVQIGHFINPHTANQPYIKNITFEVLPPNELGDSSAGGAAFPDWRVNMRRFRGECKTLLTLMESYQNAATKPICFFDGSLILSFAGQMQPARQRHYIQAVMDLLDASERYRVPLVGYVDTSYAKDLVSVLEVLLGRGLGKRVSDGALLRSRMGWGDRTTAFSCARDDSVEPIEGRKYYPDVHFVYLKTTADRPPSRLDLPRWLLESSQLEHVVDVVRAECVVGNGYPYSIETADAVAVITHQDREKFYRLFQEFAIKENLPLRFSRKALSKRGRR